MLTTFGPKTDFVWKPGHATEYQFISVIWQCGAHSQEGAAISDDVRRYLNCKMAGVRWGVIVWRVLFASALFSFLVLKAEAQTPVDRGDYLVNSIMACGNCHTPRRGDGEPISEQALSGGVTITTPAFVATASNITPDVETGIGAWTDDEIKHALIEGVRPDHGRFPGVALAPVMPANFYKALSTADLDAIVAYLRMIKPVRHNVDAPEYKALVPRPRYPDAQFDFNERTLADPVNRGRYLVTIGHCMECHSAWSRGVSDYAGGLGRGGRPFTPSLVKGLADTWKGTVAPNITSDPAAGIGAWTDHEIDRAIRQGISRDNRQLQPPMPYRYYARLSDRDVNDIIAYLRTLPPLK
jgi:mono/diheme cytochrome c family protein